MTNEHVTAEEVRSFRAGELPVGAVRRVANHVASCADCAAFAESDGSTVRAASSLSRALADVDDDHLREDALTHLAHCEHCREDVADLVAIASPAKPGTSRRLAIAGIAAAVAAALTIAFLVMTRRPPATEVAPVATASSTTRELPPHSHARPEWIAAVDAAIATGKLAPPAAFLRLQQPPDAFRGEVQAALPELRLTQPVDEVVETTRPIIRWSPMKGATYVVAIAEHAQPVRRSRELSGSEWQLDADLQRGHTYEWQLEVRRDGQVATLPAPPDPPIRFTVLAADAASELAAARASAAGDHLLLAVLYARAGLRRETEAELRLLASQLPAAAPLARTLLESIDHWPRRARS